MIREMNSLIYFWPKRTLVHCSCLLFFRGIIEPRTLGLVKHGGALRNRQVDYFKE